MARGIAVGCAIELVAAVVVIALVLAAWTVGPFVAMELRRVLP